MEAKDSDLRHTTEYYGSVCNCETLRNETYEKPIQLELFNPHLVTRFALRERKTNFLRGNWKVFRQFLLLQNIKSWCEYYFLINQPFLGSPRPYYWDYTSSQSLVINWLGRGSFASNFHDLLGNFKICICPKSQEGSFHLERFLILISTQTLSVLNSFDLLPFTFDLNTSRKLKYPEYGILLWYNKSSSTVGRVVAIYNCV